MPREQTELHGLASIEGAEDHAGQFDGIVDGGQNLRSVCDRLAAQTDCCRYCCGNEECTLEALVSGVRALAIAFEGSPPDAGLYQLIPVE